MSSPRLALAEALVFYRQADEVVLGATTRLAPLEIDHLVRTARQVARPGMARLLAEYQPRVIEDEWEIAAGRLLHLGECWFEPNVPPRIVVNRRAVDWLAGFMLGRAGVGIGGTGGIVADAFTISRLTELVVAHELYHLVTHNNSPAAELAAHVFSRAIANWPFSPLLLPEIHRLARSFV